MRKKLTILGATALMLATMVALSGVAQAAPIGGSADAKCAKLAIQTLGPSFNPSNYTFIGGTESGDNLSDRAGTSGPDVFCGFGGNDSIVTLAEGDIFLGGAGEDFVDSNAGTFYGGSDTDIVGGVNNPSGTFYGEEGNDIVSFNVGTFYGGPGYDSVAHGNPPVDGV